MKCITFNLKHNMHLYWRTYLLTWQSFISCLILLPFFTCTCNIYFLSVFNNSTLIFMKRRTTSNSSEMYKLSHAVEIVTLLVLFTVKRYGTHLQKEFKQIPITIYHQASGVIIKLRLFRQMKPKRLALRQNRYWWLMYSTARNILP